MPQHHMFDVGPGQMRDFRILIRPPMAGREHTEVIVSVQRPNQPAPFPVWVGALPGLESDFLMTLVTEATSAWAYGNDARDVMRACASVKKQARRHAWVHQP